MLHTPHVVPCVALAYVLRVLIGVELRLELSLAVAWLHECGDRVVLVTPVLCALVEYSGNAVAPHGLGHAGDAMVVVSIFQRARHCPVVGIVRVGDIIWYIAVILIESYAPVVVEIRCCDACFKRLFGIESCKALQVGVGNDRYRVVAYHHVGLAAPHVPYRQAPVLLIECNE